MWAVVGLAWLGGDLEKSGLSLSSLGSFGVSTVAIVVFFGALVVLGIGSLTGLVTGIGFLKGRRWAARVSLLTNPVQMLATFPILIFGVVLGTGGFLFPPCLLSLGGAGYTLWVLVRRETGGSLN